jgi:hypothetical protein
MKSEDSLASYIYLDRIKPRRAVFSGSEDILASYGYLDSIKPRPVAVSGSCYLHG